MAILFLFLITFMIYMVIGFAFLRIVQDFTTIISADDYALSIVAFWPIIILIVGIGEIYLMCKEIFGNKKEKLK